MNSPQEQNFVTLSEDEECVQDMNTVQPGATRRYKPIPYCPKRNPSKKGGNSTSKNSETKDFEKHFAVHHFLQKPRFLLGNDPA